jgi:glycosyltransferase involved in cell wall biosynthesis
VKVLLQGRTRRSLAASPGGDQVQIEETAASLVNDLGVHAEVSPDLEPSLDCFDLVHLFGLVRPQDVWVQAQNAVRQGKPIALSTVYCDVWEFERFGRGGAIAWLARHSNRDVIEGLKAVGRGLISREWHSGTAAMLTRGYGRMQLEVLAASSVFLPNSMSEWRRLTKDLRVPPDADRVVPVTNAVRLRPASTEGLPPRIAALERDLRGCVLCVARIEGRKNQLNLIRAIARTNHTLVLAGKPTSNQRHYHEQVTRAAEASPNVVVLGPVTEDEKDALFRLAAVHALPSWMETTGLSSLEAAAHGCALVISPNGDTREYFGSEAEYCDPSDVESIRSAIERASRRGPSEALRQQVADKRTWQVAARQTLRAYEMVLSGAAVPAMGAIRDQRP